MQLIVKGKPISEEVSNNQITNSLYTLSGKRDSIVLAKNNQEYIQSVGTPQNGFVLEYRAGEFDEHYKCVNDVLSIEQVAKAFKNFYAQNDKWKTDLSWEKKSSITINKSSSGKIINILTGIGLAAYLIWKYFFSS